MYGTLETKPKSVRANVEAFLSFGDHRDVKAIVNDKQLWQNLPWVEPQTSVFSFSTLAINRFWVSTSASSFSTSVWRLTQFCRERTGVTKQKNCCYENKEPVLRNKSKTRVLRIAKSSQIPPGQLACSRGIQSIQKPFMPGRRRYSFCDGVQANKLIREPHARLFFTAKNKLEMFAKHKTAPSARQ